MIEHILDRFKYQKEIDEVFVVSNHRFFDDFRFWANSVMGIYNFTISILDDGSTSNQNRRGAVGALAFALTESNATEAIVVAGDNLFSESPDVMKDFFSNIRPKSVLLGLHDVGSLEKARNYGVVSLSRNQQVISFQEKPAAPDSTLVSTALYYFPAAAVKLIKIYLEDQDCPDNLGEMIRRMVGIGTRVYGHMIFGEWFDIGTLETYEQVRDQYGR
jgi:glucose-1-phosphate thymidylyltransferase